MSEKLWIALALTIIALALIVTLAVLTSKAASAVALKENEVAEKLLKIIRAIVIALLTLIGGAGASTLMTGCTAMRSITVQGTVIQRHDSDTTRVIISSQESYKGVKKQ